MAIKNMNWRRYLKYFLWVMVVFCILGALRGFTVAAKVNALKESLIEQPANAQQEQKENYATSIGAETFAQKFIIEYFRWNKDDYQERADRLKPFLREGVDEQAGLRFDSLAGSSSTEKTEFLEISETGKDTALFTFKVTHKVKVMTEAKDRKGKVRKEEKESGPFEKWIQVPVITKDKAFLINGIPTFTNKPLPAKLKPIEDKPEVVDADPKTMAELNKFLKTFFKQYSTGTAAELEYLTKDKSIHPLDGTIAFKEIEKLVIIEKDKKSSTVDVDVVFTENNSKAEILQKFKLEVSEQNGSWQVIKKLTNN